MVNYKKCLLMALTIVGSMIGVGFATGREIVSFFVRYGKLSIVMLFAVFVLFFVFIFLVFCINMRNALLVEKCKNERNVVKNAGTNGKTDKNFAFFEAVVFVCQLAISSTMIAGFSNLVLGSFPRIVQILGAMLLCILLYFLVTLKRGSVYVLNIVLTILMVCFVCLTLIMAAISGVNVAGGFVRGSYQYFLNPISYVGMNLIIVYPLLKEFAGELNSCKEVKLLSFFIAIIMLVCLLVVGGLLMFFGGEFVYGEMPIIDMAKTLNGVFGGAYSVVVAVSIFTTALSTIYGSSKFLMKKVAPNWSICLVLVLSFIISLFGFGNLIDYFYPAVGVVCIVFLVIMAIKNRKNNKSS